MNKPEFKKLFYMNIQQLTNFPYIENDFDAITDYELICKVVGHLNEIIKNDNLQNNVISELYDNFILLKEYVDKYLVDIEDLKDAIKLINETITVLIEKINKNASDISTLRVDLTELINQNYNILKEYVDYNDDILNEKIENIEIGSINVYNPTNGLLQPLQDVINSLYDSANKDGLTATEFDALELSATAFDAYEITAAEFDSSGKTILV